ncbi:MAG: hypothetical protein LBV59_03150 [Sphingobacterium sp.]|jgi:hypothetical protein|uniref:hypothetical protein n=1 Tax=Sphingobacterium sp. TaxID=341027 RepID=UPI00283FC36E|nr:hypothetical protein [Sphingobacterium sp.]MDR3006903.1 hypothetical protein [Sphingobacterium sp.]
MNFLRYLTLLIIIYNTESLKGQVLESLKAEVDQNVGDIKPDRGIDLPLLKVCYENNIPQYYSVDGGYHGGRREILRLVERKLFLPSLSGPTAKDGFITVRFVVNCDGKSGRFRVLQVDNNYRTAQFGKAHVSAILDFTKSLKDWKIGKIHQKPTDYYQYLTFVIRNGKITDILP